VQIWTGTAVLTSAELAQWLKMSRRQTYDMTRARGQTRMEHPLSVARINGNIRSMNSDIDDWLSQPKAGLR
jgi:predicted DNA-binding transcriptional regulator AlpA